MPSHPLDSHHTYAPATLAVAAGRPVRSPGSPVNPPLVLSSTYVSQGHPAPGDYVYARMGTETWHPLEETLALLEHADHPGIVFSSGMAAIAAVLALVPDHGTIVVPQHAYQTTLGFIADLAQRHQLTITLVDIANTADVIAALPGADLLYVESPTNPMLEIADLPAVIAAAREHGVLVAVDNTFATPLGQRPLTWGADLVLHSITKYLAGHSDVVLGAVLSSDARLAERIRTHRTLHGAIPGPFETWLALRGIRTLSLRMERAQANALTLAQRLSRHPQVAEVRYPGLPHDPGYERASRLMDGYGAIIGILIAGGPQAADAVVDRVRLWLPATSLGGVESSLERRRRFSTEAATVPENLLRLSVGIEDVDDLWADLSAALEGA